jgi:epoxyqueuosine reductase
VKRALQQRAAQLGFDACRVTTAAPPESAGHFTKWLEAGRHGEMKWIERNAPRRVEPQQVLPDVRSIVTLAASYHAGPEATPQNGQTQGVVARYARFRDYHDVLGEHLNTLAAFIDERGGPGTRSLWYVDTGPVLERDLAQRSGLGFIGKHTNLVSRTLGNWIFLAEILTTLELPPDEPEKNRCGTCSRCIEACPTRAITAPFELDARRCISYLTIELKGAIPEELRPAIGNRIFGCDDCLAVCPWNRFAQAGQMMRPFRREEFNAPDLLEWLALDAAGFKAKFRGTPIERLKRRGLLRNVCVALGNVGDARAIPALERAAADSEPLIAEHAQWGIARIHQRPAVRAAD